MSAAVVLGEPRHFVTMVSDIPAVPGYVLVELLGFGATGEVWLAREVATGDPVAVKLLRARDDLQALARIRREATVLASVRHPHIVALRKVLTLERRVALVLDHAAGGSLAQLLVARRRLEPGEVVTLATPLAQALADIHARGVVHGDVTPGNVLFAPDGRPMLADLGVARIVGELDDGAEGTEGFVDPAVLAGAPPGPAGDVYGLAAVCLTAVTGSSRLVPGTAGDSPLASVLGRALDPCPEVRPTAAELAAALYDACPPLPVRLHRPLEPAELAVAGARTERVRRGGGADAAAARPSGHRRERAPRPWRLVAWAAAGSAAVALAVTAGVWWAASSHDGQPPTLTASGGSSVPSATGPRWHDVVVELDRRRGQAFTTSDASLLDGVYAAGTAELAVDRAALRRLEEEGLRMQGGGFDVERVDVVFAGGQRAVLAVTDRLPDYRYVDAAGRAVARASGRPARTFELTLSRQGDRWLIAGIAPATDAATGS